MLTSYNHSLSFTIIVPSLMHKICPQPGSIRSLWDKVWYFARDWQMSTKNVGKFEAEASQEVCGWPTFQVLKHLGGHAVCTNIGKEVSGMIAHTHTPQSILATILDPRLLKSQNCSHIFKNEFIALGVIMKRKNQLEYSAFEAEKPAGVFSFFSQKIYLFATRLQF